MAREDSERNLPAGFDFEACGQNGYMGAKRMENIRQDNSDGRKERSVFLSGCFALNHEPIIEYGVC